MPETLLSLSQQLFTDLVSCETHEILVDTLFKELLTRQLYGPLVKQATPSPAAAVSVPSRQTPSLLNGAQGMDSNAPSVAGSGQPSRQPTPCVELTNRQRWVSGVAGRDVFGQEKVSDSTRYFACTHCSRRIAGNRFAAHLDRCLGGRAARK